MNSDLIQPVSSLLRRLDDNEREIDQPYPEKTCRNPPFLGLSKHAANLGYSVHCPEGTETTRLFPFCLF